MAYRYIDIHTHNLKAPSNEVLTIVNVHEYFSRVPQGRLKTAGFHPWYLDSFYSEKENLETLVQQPETIAVGECGLDKVCSTPWKLQLEAFTFQVLLANSSNKPLLLHCVRGYDEIIQILESQNNRVPVIFHGFNKSSRLAARLVEKRFYLSFGLRVNKSGRFMADALTNVPRESVFFETDDSNATIATIYECAAKILNIPVDVLILQIQANFKKVFNI
jgi:TatD DNase family protein